METPIKMQYVKFSASFMFNQQPYQSLSDYIYLNTSLITVEFKTKLEAYLNLSNLGCCSSQASESTNRVSQRKRKYILLKITKIGTSHLCI